jgi:imidazolonepropionase-like amidohydrolase
VVGRSMSEGQPHNPAVQGPRWEPGELRLNNAQVLGIDGVFRPGSVAIRDGIFVDPAHEEDLGVVSVDASRFWLTPGFVDAHTHLAWRTFDAADHEVRPVEERRSDAALNTGRTLRAGVTSIRDAGGLSAADLEPTTELRAALSLRPLGVEDARGPAHLRAEVSRLADAGATWIKVLATGGVGSGERVLEPIFDAEELHAIHAAADQAGLPVMVHAWGGDGLTWALDFGAASIEHAVLISEEQCRRAATQATVVVPTVWIYQDVANMIDTGLLPPVLAPATHRAVGEHPAAVRRCLEAGVELAMGTDAGLDSQHGRNLHELAALIEAGASVEAALLAGTAVGARLIGRPDLGVIKPGSPADLVCFSADPSTPATLRDPRTVSAVIADGRVVAGSVQGEPARRR